MNCTDSNRRLRAFTLIEILAVIGIIAILAAILFPVLSRAKEAAVKTAAITQLTQLGKGIGMYADDNNDRLPPATNYDVPETAPNRIWCPIVLPYVKDEKIFIAPGSDGTFAKDWSMRGNASIGLNTATAIWRRGCDEGQKETDGCVAFTKAAHIASEDSPSSVGLLAVTPNGDLKMAYLGYEFSPYNGVPNAQNPKLGAPLVSDKDLVKEMQGKPAHLLKPIFCRYLASGQGDGVSPVYFADGHAKAYSANQIADMSDNIIWRFR